MHDNVVWFLFSINSTKICHNNFTGTNKLDFYVCKMNQSFRYVCQVNVIMSNEAIV